MKTFTSTLRIGACLLFALALSLTANAQIFVANFGLGTISKFNLDGSLHTQNFITGLSNPHSIAVSGGFLYVANEGSGTIGKYTTAGVPVAVALVSGLNGPRGIAVSGTDLYVANTGAGTVVKFTTAGLSQVFGSIVGGASVIEAVAVSGTDLYVAFRGNSPHIGKYTTAGVALNASFIPFVAGVQCLGIAVEGTDLYLLINGSPGRVEKYTTGGTLINGLLVTGVTAVGGIAVHGSELFVSAAGTVPNAGTIGQYGTAGSVLNATLVSGLNAPHGIAVQGCDFIYDPYCFTTLAGAPRVFGTLNGIGSAARFNEPWGVAVDGAGTVYVADTQNHIIRRITAGGVVSIIAGNPGVAGFADGTDGSIGGSARFNRPTGVALTSDGTLLYVADYNNHAIRKIDLTQLPLTTATYVTTLAGNGTSGKDDGFGSAARFNNPFGVAVDITGGVWVTDQNNQTIRVVIGGTVFTYAGDSSPTGNGYVNGPRLGGAKFNTPRGIAIDSNRDIYVADSGNFVVRKITGNGGVVSTLAGHPSIPFLAGCVDGPGSSARFSQVSAMSPFGGPTGVAVDSLGNVYVTDAGNHVIRRINQNLLPTDPNFVTTLAGSPTSPAYDQAAIFQYFSFGTLPPLIGSADGTGSAAQFYFPGGVAVDAMGRLYVADTLNHLIRIQCASAPPMANCAIYDPYCFTNRAGLASNSGANDGTGSAARFNKPWGVAVDSMGNAYVADTDNHTIRKITAVGVVTLLAGAPGIAGLQDGTGGVGGVARFNRPTGVALNSAGTVLYVADYNNHTIRKIDLSLLPSSLFFVSTVAGSAGSPGTANGAGVLAQFRNPFGVAVDSTGNIYVTDQNNQTVRKITAGVVTTFAGSPGVGGYAPGANTGGALFNTPRGIGVDGSGNVYVADSGNGTVRKISGGFVTTHAGHPFTPFLAGCDDGLPGAARFSVLQAMSPCGGPSGLAVDSLGNVYVTDQGNHTIRKITPLGSVTTLAGLPATSGSAEGTGSAARFHCPGGVAVDATGKLYVADTYNHTIRVQCPPIHDCLCEPATVKLALYAGLTIQGTIGCIYRIEYTTFLNPNPSLTVWTTLTTILLPSSPYLFIDTTVVSGTRFYRVVPL